MVGPELIPTVSALRPTPYSQSLDNACNCMCPTRAQLLGRHLGPPAAAGLRDPDHHPTQTPTHPRRFQATGWSSRERLALHSSQLGALRAHRWEASTLTGGRPGGSQVRNGGGALGPPPGAGVGQVAEHLRIAVRLAQRLGCHDVRKLWRGRVGQQQWVRKWMSRCRCLLP
jgi:hypothetical protein